MRIAYITSGAAGMFCGSCMKDNALVTALITLGHDALLIPTYTPIRTDEFDVSQKRIFFGGINVYLQQKSRLFRHTPRWFDRWLDVPGLLRWAGRFATRTQAERLGGLTVSMLQGEHGHQRKEVDKLVGWLAGEFRPDVVVLSNVLISGLVPALKERWAGSVLATLQGDDIFLAALPFADRQRSVDLIRRNGATIDGYLVTSTYYADFMSGYLGLPRERMHIVPPGVNLAGHGGLRAVRTEPPFVLGYLARICPEKGLHNLVDAYRVIRQTPNAPPCRLRMAGWLGEQQRAYFDEQLASLSAAGLAADVEYVDCPTHADKVRFLQSLDLFSVPTVYHEPKGIYVLEALANGVPVVQPRHGSFPELVEATAGGMLVEPGDVKALARTILELLANGPRRRQLAEQGHAAVHARYSAQRMAEQTVAVLAQYHAQQAVQGHKAA